MSEEYVTIRKLHILVIMQTHSGFPPTIKHFRRVLQFMSSDMLYISAMNCSVCFTNRSKKLPTFKRTI